jgi:CRP/FNR family cyclic AMP-dependent transcriptional regulator
MLRQLPAWLGWIRDPAQLDRVAILARTPLFAGLPRRLLGRLGAQLFEKGYAAGEQVFREGDPGKALFVVLTGEVEVLRETPLGGERLAVFGPGTAFGELALIDDLPRSATARATTPARLLILYRTHFEALVEGDRGIALVVMRNLLRTLSGYVRAVNTIRTAAAPPAPAPAPAPLPVAPPAAPPVAAAPARAEP